MIRFYDEAVVNKIANVLLVDKNHIHVLKPNEVNRLWKIALDENNDQPLELPLIGISRDPSVNLLRTHRGPLSCQGVTLYSDVDKSIVIQMDAIPFEVTYQLDIYTKSFEDGDEYMRSVVFNLINYSKILVEIPYNGANIKHTAYLEMDPSVTDNSDIPEKKFPDQFTRWTIRFKLYGGYLFSLPITTPAKLVGVQLEVRNNKKEIDERTTVIDTEDSNKTTKN